MAPTWAGPGLFSPIMDIIRYIKQNTRSATGYFPPSQKSQAKARFEPTVYCLIRGSFSHLIGGCNYNSNKLPEVKIAEIWQKFEKKTQLS